MPLAADGADLARRCVEDVDRGGRCAPFPEGVEAAAVEPVAVVGPIEVGVAFGHGHGLPDPVRLVRPDARAAQLADQRSADGESAGRGSSRRPCGTAARAKAAG